MDQVNLDHPDSMDQVDQVNMVQADQVNMVQAADPANMDHRDTVADRNTDPDNIQEVQAMDQVVLNTVLVPAVMVEASLNHTAVHKVTVMKEAVMVSAWEAVRRAGQVPEEAVM